MYRLTQLMKYKMMILAVFGLVLVPSLVGAATTTDTFGLQPIEDKTSLGNKDLRETVASLINVAMGLLGIVAVVIILIGGFQWMTAGGNDEKVAEARKRIFAGIIGLAIILSAWAITLFVFRQLSTATGIKDTKILDDTFDAN